jgi:amino acid adenylation domain-containing protein
MVVPTDLLSSRPPSHRPLVPPGPPPAPEQAPCLHHLFEHQVERAPDAVAVVHQGRCLSYRQLNRRANHLAHQLRLLGVGPGVLVGLCAERSPELVAGILGILKAGGAYVPLDPAYPGGRLAVMLEEARVPVLVTQPHLAGNLPAHQAELVYLEGAEALAAGPEVVRPFLDGRPDDLAYVIFTSGSTGRPKGVMVRHRNVTALLNSTQPWYNFGPEDVWTLFHSFAFDFSVWELWGALAYGGRLVVVPYETSRSPRAFYELLRAEHVTVLNQTPSAFRQLIRVEEAEGAELRKQPGAAELALRWVIFGGEALALPTLRPWFERHGDQRPRLVNMYGITETTVHVTYRPITWADLDAGRGSVIGRAIPGWQVYLCDPAGNMVPDGETGEIVVGGAGVARGYLNLPELTAERFPPDPQAAEADARLYKSGDLARRLPDGDLVYLGRIDHQVKIRGFRIELLEIETVLARHPAVREAAVLAREDVPGEKRLVAYVTARPGSCLAAPEVRGFLREQVPDYMVPAAFVFVRGLPMTAHGKVNRELLPAPAAQRPDRGEGFVAPGTDCQRRLQHIWETLLHLRPVGIRDNFFELGGDSLLAMNLCLEVKKAFGREVPPAVFFQGATIEELAEALARPEGLPGWSALVPIQPRGDKPPFFCVHPLGGQVLGYRLLARHLGDDQPFFGVQGRPIHDDETYTLLEDRAAQYVAEVLQVQPQGPYYLGGYSLGAFIAFEMAQQLHRQGRHVAFLALLDDGPALIHDQSGWSLREVASFLGNVPHWLTYQLLRRSGPALARDVWRKLKVWVRRWFGRTAGWVDVEEALDVSRYSESYRRRLANSYQALKDYMPGVYPGRVAVFRARTQPLLGSHQPDLGWGKRAAQGVEVYVIPGDHNSLVTEPDVAVLGRRLAEALGRARAAATLAKCA